MKRTKLPILCFLFVSAVATAQTFNINLDDEKSVASNAEDAAGDEVKSLGRGVGVNETEALKDAYRDAIERAIGLYVDAETVAKNDEIVKDQILTQSNAYIARYGRLKTSNLSGGLVEVRILATIKKRALAKKVTDAMPGVTFNLGQGMQNLHAEIVSKDKRNMDAAALLDNVLKELDPVRQLMSPKICIETQRVIKGPKDGREIYWFSNGEGIPENQIGVSYLFKVEFDRDKYFKEIVPKLRAVLNQISLEKPKEFRISSIPITKSNNHDFFYDKDSFFKGGRYYYGFYYPVVPIQGSVNNIMLQYEPSLPNDCGRFHVSSIEGMSFRVSPCVRQGFDKSNISVFTLVSELNEKLTTGKAVFYVLDRESTKKVGEWFVNRGCEDVISRRSSGVIYNVVFLDKEGNEILVKHWKIPYGFLMNFGQASYYYQSEGYKPTPKLWRSENFVIENRSQISVFYSSPFVGCAGESFMQWQDFVFHKDDLSKIKQVRIEPAE